jgi:hypothetical protein
MPRGVGRPPKSVSRTNSQDRDGESGDQSSGDFQKTTAPYSYIAPQWLLEKQTQKYFSVPIPAVPEPTRVAIEEKFGRDGTLHRSKNQSTKMVHQLRQLQHDLQSHRQKTKLQKEKVAASISAKEEKLEELKRVRELEIEKRLEGLEQKLLKQQEQRNSEEEEKVRAQIAEDFDRNFEDEQKAKRKYIMESQKREEKEEATEQAERDSKRPKTKDPRLKSEMIQKKIDEAKSNTEKLTEMKSEMVWLLKQVIKAEMKQKLGLKKKKAIN